MLYVCSTSRTTASTGTRSGLRSRKACLRTYSASTTSSTSTSLRMPYALTYAHVCPRMPTYASFGASGMHEKAPSVLLSCFDLLLLLYCAALLGFTLLYAAARCIWAARNRPMLMRCITLLHSALLCCQVHLGRAQPAYVHCQDDWRSVSQLVLERRRAQEALRRQGRQGHDPRGVLRPRCQRPGTLP